MFSSVPELSSADGRGLLRAADVEDAAALGRRDDAAAAQQAAEQEKGEFVRSFMSQEQSLIRFGSTLIGPT